MIVDGPKHENLFLIDKEDVSDKKITIVTNMHRHHRGFPKSPYPMLGALNDEIARGGLCED